MRVIARRSADWLLLPAARVYVAVLFVLLIIAGSFVALSLSDVQAGNNHALRKVNGLAAETARNEKKSIESRVSTVSQRCSLTRLIEASIPAQSPATREKFEASLSKCLTQLKSVEALNARTR